jgi:hypothetical protein
MADTKITALAAITTVDPAADVLPIVDISDTSMAASGTTKKVTSNQILGAGGTATLASATITGDLTVDTSTLKVDATNNRVGFGTSTPSADAEFYKSTNGQNRVLINNPSTGTSAYSSIDLTTGTTGGKILQLGSGYSGAYPYITGSTVLQNDSIGGITLHSVGPYPIYFGTNNTLRATLDSSGNLGLGVTPSAGGGVLQLKSGITFPATQVASSDANTLDDYEEGTFTPTIIGTSTAGTGTYSVQSGTYTKVGRLVSCQIFLDWTAHTGTGDMRISGLPFQVSSASNYFAAAAIGYFSNVSLSAGNIATGYAINATSVITLGQYPTGGGAGAGIAMDTSGEILISVTYIV